MNLAAHGQGAQAAGWTARAEQLAEQLPPDDVERGYVTFLQMFARLMARQYEPALVYARKRLRSDSATATPV